MKSVRVLLTLAFTAFLLVSYAQAAVAARGGPDEDPSETRSNRGAKGPPSNESSKPREAGRIVSSNLSAYDGRYVDFSFDRDACKVSDYRVYNTTILSSIQLPSPCDGRQKGGSEHGAAVQVGGKDASVRIHDAPNGLIHLQGSPGHALQIVAAPGVAMSPGPDGQNFTIGNLTGILRFEDNGTASNISGKARLWVHPLAGGSSERVEIRQAIKERRVAGEVDVLVENGTVSSEVLTYEDVIVRAQRGANASFRFLVDANLTSGRTFVVNLGPGVFTQEKVGLRYWDLDATSAATEVAITEADDLDDVLEILPGEGPEYWITHDDAGKHVLVAVPHFSAHVFEIASIPPEVVPIVIWGLIGGTAFVGLGAVGMFRRREQA